MTGHAEEEAQVPVVMVTLLVGPHLIRCSLGTREGPARKQGTAVLGTGAADRQGLFQTWSRTPNQLGWYLATAS